MESKIRFRASLLDLALLCLILLVLMISASATMRMTAGIKDSIPSEDDNGINDWVPSKLCPANDLVGDDDLVSS